MSLDASQREAFRALARETDGIDTEVYRQAERDPLEPIIGMGRPEARIGFMGRDPGRDEVRWGEPFIGAGGQLVRRAIHEHVHGRPLPDFETSRELGRHFFWINTVPYKPLGNKAWSMKVKKRFHPLMLELLLHHWHGQDLITLGREAFLWFGLNQSKPARERLEAYWGSERRFEQCLEVELSAAGRQRVFRLHPLPHPSPLNATWYARFPGLLRQRLTQLDLQRAECE